MTRDEFQAFAWRDFLLYAFEQPDLRAAFEQDTGRRFSTPSSPMEAMIDHACGVTTDEAMAFMVWATRTQWGWEEAPAAFREAAERWEHRQGGTP